MSKKFNSAIQVMGTVCVLGVWSGQVKALPEEWIFAQGFEAGTEVVFDGDQSALFTELGQTRQLNVLVKDESGSAVLDPNIFWHLEGSTDYALTADQGGSAEVTSAGFLVGNAHLYAIDLGSGTSAVAILLMGSLADDAHYIDSSMVTGGATPLMGTADVTLVRNAQTEALVAGNVIVTNDAAGLLIRVVDIPARKGSDITLTVEPAQLTDAFDALSVRAKSETVSRRYQLDDEPSKGKTLSDDLECSTSTQNDIGFNLTGPTVDLNFNLGTEVTLELTGGSVDEFSVAAAAQASLTGKSGSVNYTSNITGKVTCIFQLPEIFTPPLPVSAFSFQLNTAPKIGFEFEAGFSGPSFTVTGPQGTVSGNAKAGFQYFDNTGWSSLSDSNWAGVFQPISTQFNASLAFTLKGGPFVTNEFGLVANLGSPPLGLQLADLRFVKLKALGELDFRLESPLNPDRTDYRGPQWDIDGVITGQYQAALADGLLFNLLNRLNIPTQVTALTGNLFDPLEIRIAEAPKPQITVTCSVGGCPADPAENETVTFRMTASTDNNGTASFVAAKDGSSFVQAVRGGSSFSGGSAMTTWTPSIKDSGSYQVYPRLVTDALSALFPYASTQSRNLTVGEVEIATVYRTVVGWGGLRDVASNGTVLSVRAVAGGNTSLYANDQLLFTYVEGEPFFGLYASHINSSGDYVFRASIETEEGEASGIFDGPNPGINAVILEDIGRFVDDVMELNDLGDVFWQRWDAGATRNLVYSGGVTIPVSPQDNRARSQKLNNLAQIATMVAEELSPGKLTITRTSYAGGTLGSPTTLLDITTETPYFYRLLDFNDLDEVLYADHNGALYALESPGSSRLIIPSRVAEPDFQFPLSDDAVSNSVGDVLWESEVHCGSPFGKGDDLKPALVRQRGSSAPELLAFEGAFIAPGVVLSEILSRPFLDNNGEAIISALISDGAGDRFEIIVIEAPVTAGVPCGG